MDIEQKAEPPLSKRIEIFCDTNGYNRSEVESMMAEVKDREDIEDDEEAFERAIAEMRGTKIEFLQITPGKITHREDAVSYFGFFARVFEGSEAKFRRVRFYPDNEEELDEKIGDYEVGGYYVSDSVIQLTRRDNQEISDQLTDNQIYGIKDATRKDEIDLSDEQLEDTKMDYIDTFGIEDDEAKDRIVKQNTWADLVDVIEEYETVKIAVFQTLNFVDVSDRETPDGEQPKPRLRTKGQVERRGKAGTHDIVIYFDDDHQLLEFKNKHDVPFKGVPQSAWVPTRETEEGEEVEIVGSTGMEVYNVKYVDVTDEKEEMLESMIEQDYYVDIEDIVDPSGAHYIEPDPEADGVEFHAGLEYPYMMIDSTNSAVQSNDQPRLGLTLFDSEFNAYSGRAYGATAYDILGIEDENPEIFLEQVEKLNGSVAKNVKVFGARSCYKNDEGQTVMTWITYGVHDYENLDEDELKELNQALNQ